MEEIVFTKMHGLGNDYAYINCLSSCPDDLPSLSMEMSDRHEGVGSDGIILILPSSIADYRMRIFNADGSEAKMCGNGIRCVGKYLYDNHITPLTELNIETLAGIRQLSLHVNPDTDRVDYVTVDMGVPVLDPVSIPVDAPGTNMIERGVVTSQGVMTVTAVSMGNPHGVLFVNDVDKIDINILGPELENHHMWPDRANIEFVEVKSPTHLRMRVWERGSGETRACGTGACAVVEAAMLTGRCDADGNKPVTVELPGGELQISKSRTGNILMTGPATTVFDGTYYRVNHKRRSQFNL